jgi:DUF4097 and DUF4098 domain-containing protein YvlB
MRPLKAAKRNKHRRPCVTGGMRAALLPLVAAAMLTQTACDFDLDLDGGHFSRDFHYSYPLNAGAKISIETFNGSIDISGWDQNIVEINGTKYGPTQQAADDLSVSVDHGPASVAIRVQRPSVTRGGMGARFTIQVPRSTVLDYLSTSNGSIHVTDGTGPARLRTSNGGIRVTGLDGSLEATTSNGPIQAELKAVNAPVRAETSNGSIDLRLPGTLHDAVRAHTSNGGITLHMPDGANARLSAHTSNASISSDFDLKMQGQVGRNNVEAVLGNGGPLVELNTSNGGIHLLRM